MTNPQALQTAINSAANAQAGVSTFQDIFLGQKSVQITRNCNQCGFYPLNYELRITN